MKKGTYYLCLLLLLSLLSCEKEFQSSQDLMFFLKDKNNGYFQSKNINGYSFSLLYKPTDLLVEQELSSFSIIEKSLRSKKVNELRDKYGKNMYFSLSISQSQKELLTVAPSNRNEFGAMVNQLVFGMKDKVHLFTPQRDTLEMLDYNYPRMYGMSKSTSMLFVYPRDEKYLENKFLNFTLHDLGIRTGEVKFKLETSKIIKQPKLSL